MNKLIYKKEIKYYLDYNNIIKHNNFNLKKKKHQLYENEYLIKKKKHQLIKINNFENKKILKYKNKFLNNKLFIYQINKIYKNPFFSFKQQISFTKKLNKNLLIYIFNIYNKIVKKYNSKIIKGRIINFRYKYKKKKIFVYSFGKIFVLKINQLLYDFERNKKRRIYNKYQFYKFFKNYLFKNMYFKILNTNSFKKKVIISRKAYVKDMIAKYPQKIKFKNKPFKKNIKKKLF